MVEKARSQRLVAPSSYMVELPVYVNTTNEQPDASNISYETIKGVSTACVSRAGFHEELQGFVAVMSLCFSDTLQK